MTAAMTARPDSQPGKGRAAIARRCPFPVLTDNCEALAGPPQVIARTAGMDDV